MKKMFVGTCIYCNVVVEFEADWYSDDFLEIEYAEHWKASPECKFRSFTTTREKETVTNA